MTGLAGPGLGGVGLANIGFANIEQGLTSYGGDPRVVASRDEMMRVRQRLSSALSTISTQVQPLAFLHRTIAHLQFSVHVPVLVERLIGLEWACQTAAEGFLTQDARVAMHLRATMTLLDDQPWLRALLRGKLAHEAMAGALVAVGLGQFFNGRAASQVARGVIDAGPLLLGVGDSHNAANNARALGGWLVGGEQRIGLGRETGILVTDGRQPVNDKFPKNIASLAARLDQVAGSRLPRIRVEQGSEVAGSRTWVIYVPGTESLALAGRGNALDMNSAIHSFAGDGQAAIDRALREAIQKSGIASGDSVVFVGYSQGGIAAANLLAGHHDFNAAGLVTFGAPIGHLNLPADLPVLAVEHTNDLIPALSGQANPLTPEWATAQREFPVPKGHAALEAHELGAYRDTAYQVDASTDAGLVRIRGQIEAALATAGSEKVSWFDVYRS